jgi:hypothetical protein
MSIVTKDEVRGHQKLEMGTSLGGMTVVSATPNQLVLRGGIRYSLLLIIGGLPVSAIGAAAWWSFFTNNPARGGPKSLIIPFVGLGMILTGFQRLFTRLCFDGERRMMVSARLLMADAVKRQEEISHVEVTILPQNLDQHETVCVDVKLRGGGQQRIGKCRVSNRKVLGLIAAAEKVARLLHVAMIVQGRCEKAQPVVKRAVEALPNYMAGQAA